uniref:CSON006403 protein n=1 Tax=Culicoides sonorensis TaxID=179676 RepID=A0A336M876_CULSO
MTFLMLITSPFIIGFITLAFIKFIYTYWDRQGFVSVQPKLIYGNLRPTVKYQQTFSNNINNLYWESITTPYIGIFLLCRPAILIRDLNLARRILIHDHEYFDHRGGKNYDPFSANLFSSKTLNAPHLNEKLSQIFNSRNNQTLFETILNEGHRLTIELEKYANEPGPVTVNLQKVLQTHILNTLSSLCFGLNVNLFEANSIIHKQDNNQFKLINNEISKNGGTSRIQQALKFLYPNTMGKFTKGSTDVESYLVDTVHNVFRSRKENNIVRGDLIQLFINQQENDNKKEDNSTPLTIQEIAAQLFNFYSNGTQILSHTIASFVHELTHNQDELDKVLNELDLALKKNHDEITYEMIQEMSYLDLCLKETLRKVPPISLISRECTKNYVIESTGQTIKTGMKIIIPVTSIQNDPKYFKSPEKFMPERFLFENTKFMTADAYMPFGIGIHSCPGNELTKLILKTTMVAVLRQFVLEPIETNSEITTKCSKTTETDKHHELLKKVIVKRRTELNNN